jgi:hypothetical protein
MSRSAFLARIPIPDELRLAVPGRLDLTLAQTRSSSYHFTPFAPPVHSTTSLN